MLEIQEKKSIEDILELISKIPEFDPDHEKEDFLKRLSDCRHLILVALWNGEKAGFKIGYDRYKDGSFYSWLGAVLPEYRRKNIALSLAEEQEKWARKNGFKKIIVKTRNRFKAMLIFLLNNGFKITELEQKNTIEENRIILEKIL